MNLSLNGFSKHPIDLFSFINFQFGENPQKSLETFHQKISKVLFWDFFDKNVKKREKMFESFICTVSNVFSQKEQLISILIFCFNKLGQAPFSVTGYIC